MSGCSMRGSFLVGGIGFIQSEFRGIIPMLQYIKTEITFFFDRILMILYSRLNKLINIFRLNNNIYNSNNHKNPPSLFEIPAFDGFYNKLMPNVKVKTGEGFSRLP